MIRLSVVIPAFNNEDTIEKCLAAVRKSHFCDYELILADCGSEDLTAIIAEKYADKILKLPRGCGRNCARMAGFDVCKADVIVNIDSDIVVLPDTLAKISDYLSEHKEIDAVTGLLSKVHPNRDFFSQYKNLYMHYGFSGLPSCINFLYGSIFAFRRALADLYDQEFGLAEDTAFGENLTFEGKKISFLRDLEVTHLKKYGFFSLLKNDFLISLNLAKVFSKYQGWHFLSSEKRLAHSSVGQICSLMVACIACAVFGLYLLRTISVFFLLGTVLLWVLLNMRFFLFLNKERGPLFVIRVVFTVFLTDLVKAAGAAWGAGLFLISVRQRKHAGEAVYRPQR